MLIPILSAAFQAIATLVPLIPRPTPEVQAAQAQQRAERLAMRLAHREAMYHLRHPEVPK